MGGSAQAPVAFGRGCAAQGGGGGCPCCPRCAVLMLFFSHMYIYTFSGEAPPPSGKLAVRQELADVLHKQRQLGVDGIAGTSNMHAVGPRGGGGRGHGRGRGRGSGRGVLNPETVPTANKWAAIGPRPQRLSLLQRLHAKDTTCVVAHDNQRCLTAGTPTGARTAPFCRVSDISGSINFFAAHPPPKSHNNHYLTDDACFTDHSL